MASGWSLKGLPSNSQVNSAVIRLGVYPGVSVMSGTANDLHGALDGYGKFLREKDLALDAHQPWLVRWGREFHSFAQGVAPTYAGKRNVQAGVWQVLSNLLGGPPPDFAVPVHGIVRGDSNAASVFRGSCRASNTAKISTTSSFNL